MDPPGIFKRCMDWMQTGVWKLWDSARQVVKVEKAMRVNAGTASPTDGTVTPMKVDTSGRVHVDIEAQSLSPIVSETYFPRAKGPVTKVAGNATISPSIDTADKVLILSVWYLEKGAATPTINLSNGTDPLTEPDTITASQCNLLDVRNGIIINGDETMSITNGAAGDEWGMSWIQVSA